MALTPEERCEGIIDDVVQLVTLPDVFHQFEQKLADPGVSVEELVEIISSDVNTVLRLLKLANSSFFGFNQRVDTVTRALILVGTQQVRDLILATAVVDQFRKISPELINAKEFWRHSLAVAATARCVAIQRRERNQERMFLLGLLHDVGRLVFYLREPQTMALLLQRNSEENTTLEELEREFFGFTHDYLGARLIERWELPDSIYLPIKHHHEPAAAKDYITETAMLHVADVVVHSLGWGQSGERLVPGLDLEAWRGLGMPVEGVDSLVANSRETFMESIALFL